MGPRYPATLPPLDYCRGKGTQMQQGCNLLPLDGQPQSQACAAVAPAALSQPSVAGTLWQGLDAPGAAQAGTEPGQCQRRLVAASEMQWDVPLSKNQIYLDPQTQGMEETHFIKDIRQHDTKNSRTALICAKRSLCAAFSSPTLQRRLRVSDLADGGQPEADPSLQQLFWDQSSNWGQMERLRLHVKFLYCTNTLVTLKTDSPGQHPHSCWLRTRGQLRVPWVQAPTSWMTLRGPGGRHKHRSACSSCYITTVTEHQKPQPQGEPLSNFPPRIPAHRANAKQN